MCVPPKASQVKDIYSRVCDIAKGAALMTGTTYSVEYNRGSNSLIPNKTLDHIMHNNMVSIPLPEYTEEELKYAHKWRLTMPDPTVTFSELSSPMNIAEKETIFPYRDHEIYDFVSPEIQAEPLLFGSTDVGDVSCKCPVVQLHATTYAAGTSLHSWQAVAQGKSSIFHKGELYAAKVMAGTIIDLLSSPTTIKKARNELAEKLGESPYESLLPPEIKPLIR